MDYSKLTGENKYWLGFFGLVAAVLMTLIISITTYNVQSNALLAKGLETSSNPMEYRCAFDPQYNREVCAILAAKK